MSAAKKAKKYRFQPISLYHRRVVFDGHGMLKCEVCGVSENMPFGVGSESPREEYTSTRKMNNRVLGFLKKHKECK